MKPTRLDCTHPAAAARMEHRADGGPVITGYAAVFYDAADPGTRYMIWDDVEERILPGAFDKAVAGDDVRALFNHSPDHVLGRTGAGTLRLSVDARGLRYEIDPPDTQTARDLMASLKRGDISGSSFAFEPRGTNFRRENSVHVCELTDVKLYDVGPVTFPAYEGTAAGLRSADVASAIRRAAERPAAARDADLIAVTLAELEAG